MLKTVRAQKVSEKKNGIICLVSMFHSWVIVLKLFEKVHLLQFKAYLSKKCKSVKAVYICAIERSHDALSENGIVHYAITHCFGTIGVWSWKILLNSRWVSIFLINLVANTSWTVAQAPKNHIIFWKRVMRTFRWIYTSCSLTVCNIHFCIWK